MPFTPTNFVSASGQLDNAGPEEIVVAADGDPGIQVNLVRVFSERGGVWNGEQVSVGGYGVTSAVVCQFPNRRPGIYLGLRRTSGAGRVVELVKEGSGNWVTNVVAESVSESAFVFGQRASAGGTELIFTAGPRFGPDGALYRAVHDGTNWDSSLLETGVSHRGSGIIRKSDVSGIDDGEPQSRGSHGY